MPRRFLQRYMPKPDTLRRQRSLRFMAPLIADPGLWLLTRRSVANAFSVGLFCAMLPIPFQMVVAALGARLSRCNLALSVGLVWDFLCELSNRHFFAWGARAGGPFPHLNPLDS